MDTVCRGLTNCEVDFVDEMDGNETHQAGEGQSRDVNPFSCASAVVSARLLAFPAIVFPSATLGTRTEYVIVLAGDSGTQSRRIGLWMRSSCRTPEEIKLVEVAAK